MPSRNGIHNINSSLIFIDTCHRIVERNRPVIVLAVYTGDPSHKARHLLNIITVIPTFIRFLSQLLLLHPPFPQQKLKSNGTRPFITSVVTVLEPKMFVISFLLFLLSHSIHRLLMESSWPLLWHISDPTIPSFTSQTETFSQSVHSSTLTLTSSVWAAQVAVP